MVPLLQMLACCRPNSKVSKAEALDNDLAEDSPVVLWLDANSRILSGGKTDVAKTLFHSDVDGFPFASVVRERHRSPIAASFLTAVSTMQAQTIPSARLVGRKQPLLLTFIPFECSGARYILAVCGGSRPSQVVRTFSRSAVKAGALQTKFEAVLPATPLPVEEPPSSPVQEGALALVSSAPGEVLPFSLQAPSTSRQVQSEPASQTESAEAAPGSGAEALDTHGSPSSRLLSLLLEAAPAAEGGLQDPEQGDQSLDLGVARRQSSEVSWDVSSPSQSPLPSPARWEVSSPSQSPLPSPLPSPARWGGSSDSLTYSESFVASYAPVLKDLKDQSAQTNLSWENEGFTCKSCCKPPPLPVSEEARTIAAFQRLMRQEQKSSQTTMSDVWTVISSHEALAPPGLRRIFINKGQYEDSAGNKGQIYSGSKATIRGANVKMEGLNLMHLEREGMATLTLVRGDGGRRTLAKRDEGRRSSTRDMSSPDQTLEDAGENSEDLDGQDHHFHAERGADVPAPTRRSFSLPSFLRLDKA